MNQQTLIYHMLRDVKRISPFCERFLVHVHWFYRAQNEAYKGGDGEKRRKALPVKELCVMAASGRTKRNVYMGLHSV